MTGQPFHFPLEEDARDLARDRAEIEGINIGVYRDSLGYFVSSEDWDAERVYTHYRIPGEEDWANAQ